MERSPLKRSYASNRVSKVARSLNWRMSLFRCIRFFVHLADADKHSEVGGRGEILFSCQASRLSQLRKNQRLRHTPVGPRHTAVGSTTPRLYQTGRGTTLAGKGQQLPQYRRLLAFPLVIKGLFRYTHLEIEKGRPCRCDESACTVAANRERCCLCLGKKDRQ